MVSRLAFINMGDLAEGSSAPGSRRGGRVAESALIRVLDIAVAVIFLVLAAPLLVALALAIWAQDGACPIYAHRRIGRGGRSFPCLKFRSMVPNSEARLNHLLSTDAAAAAEWARDHKLRNDPRITPLGRLLRKSSLDEVPQLLNVVLGQMSLVGPRPIIESEIVRYGRYFHHYCSVRPGITGLWQVSGRNDVSYRRRVVLDTVYSRSKSLRTDLFVLTRTIPAVVSARGCS